MFLGYIVNNSYKDMAEGEEDRVDVVESWLFELRAHNRQDFHMEVRWYISWKKILWSNLTIP